MNDTVYYKECMTIVVPVYNRPDLIVRCLESMKSQTYRPLHIIVVDNASTDDTASQVSEWMGSNSESDLILELLSESRRGAAYARDTGLGKVKTEKVMFFDSDDVMRHNAVTEIMDAWKKDPSADAVAWPLMVHAKSGDRLSHAISGNLLERHMVHAIFCTLGYAVKTDVIRACGGWNGKYSCWDDLETGVRILLDSPKVRALKFPIAEVFPQVESISGISFFEKQGKWEEALDGIDESISASSRGDKQRLHNIVSYRRAILAADYYKEGHPELAKPLYEQALSEVPTKKRPLIRFAYHWTKRRLRGAFYIVGKLL